MSSRKQRVRSTNSNDDPGPQGIRIFYATLILFIAALIGILLQSYRPFLFSGLDWSTEHIQDDSPQTKMLYGDIASAKKPFDEGGFNISQLFGSSPHWGSLNSGHYFGLKLTTPNSLETSLMWFKNELNKEGRLSIRHLCDQNDQLDFYSWTRHDFWTFGDQEIHDKSYKLTTSYIKDPENPFDWQAKIKFDPQKDDSNMKPISIIYYITTNNQRDTLELSQTTRSFSQPGDTLYSMTGNSADIGDFQLNIKLNSLEDQFIKSTYLVGHVDKSRLSMSAYLQSKMMISNYNGTQLFNLPSKSYLVPGQVANIIAVQVIVRARSSITLDFRQRSTNDSEKSSGYDSRLATKISEFDEKFDREFPMPDNDESLKTLARASLSNMIGSVGYFFGTSYIGSSLRQEEVAPYGPLQLLTGVPSRSFFPRGFLWDEGFHNLLISQWDPKLSNKIIISWFNIMNENGWIPREVILGIESMRRVPYEFIVQRIANANPPAMLLVVERMLDSGTLEDSSIQHLYPRLKQWLNWFNMTQFGLIPTTFRWRGRDELSVSMLNPKTLTSGLDDYPRASHPSANEYHIDLRCWMALASRTVAKLAERLGDEAYASLMSTTARELSENSLLDKLHWSEEHQMYCDFGINAEGAELVLVRKMRRTQQGHLESYGELERRITGQPKMGCVPEFGYVSLFPMIMNLLDPDSEKLGVLLNRLRDKNELWTEYGLRSLSKSSKYYRKYNTEHDKPYWRGPIWVNLNFLTLVSLKHYSKQKGPYQELSSSIFKELRENLVKNVLSEFNRTGYLWENYDDLTGRGQGSHPFTGWSSLILLIMSNRL